MVKSARRALYYCSIGNAPRPQEVLEGGGAFRCALWAAV
jgi:hypothetical protein